MTFVLMGVNHKTAPVEVREALAVPSRSLAAAHSRLKRQPGLAEGLILSTCNRTEVLACPSSGCLKLEEFFRSFPAARRVEFQKHLYEYRDGEVVQHVFRVATGLDSMVLGEQQILGQMKEACAIGRVAGTIRSRLDRLMAHTFAVAKRVRSETGIGRSSVSVASVAVDLAERIFGSLRGKKACLVGAGKMSELAAQRLVNQGADLVFVAHRNLEHASELADKFGSKAILFEQLNENADRADIVIASTGAPHAIFRREHGESFLKRRKGRPMFFIDIAVPRDVEPEMSRLDGIFVYDIDDLQEVAEKHRGLRREEAVRAEAIIAAETQRFLLQLQERDVVPAIASLRAQIEAIRKSELERMHSRLATLTPEQQVEVEEMTRRLVNKLLHGPLTVLKAASRRQDQQEVIAVVQRLFALGGGTHPLPDPADATRK